METSSPEDWSIVRARIDLYYLLRLAQYFIISVVLPRDILCSMNIKLKYSLASLGLEHWKQ